MSLKEQLINNALGKEINQLYELIKNILIKCSKNKKLCANIIIVSGEAIKTNIETNTEKYQVKIHEHNFEESWTDFRNINSSDEIIVYGNITYGIIKYTVDKFEKEKINIECGDLCELEKINIDESENIIKKFFKKYIFDEPDPKHHDIGYYLIIDYE